MNLNVSPSRIVKIEFSVCLICSKQQQRGCVFFVSDTNERNQSLKTHSILYNLFIIIDVMQCSVYKFKLENCVGP
jgi:hypothetical protein